MTRLFRLPRRTRREGEEVTEDRRPRPVWRTARTVGGFTLIGVGIIGTLLPIIPGIPMVIAGVALVGPGHRALRPVMTRIERWRRRKQVP
jgi:hypothetical protein